MAVSHVQWMALHTLHKTHAQKLYDIVIWSSVRNSITHHIFIYCYTYSTDIQQRNNKKRQMTERERDRECLCVRRSNCPFHCSSTFCCCCCIRCWCHRQDPTVLSMPSASNALAIIFFHPFISLQKFRLSWISTELLFIHKNFCFVGIGCYVAGLALGKFNDARLNRTKKERTARVSL